MPLKHENDPSLVRVENLEKRYEHRGFLREREEAGALRGVSLTISACSTLALIGSSGCGKSTLALCLACLERPTSGKIWFGSREITSLNEKEIRELRPQIQMVFQD